MNPEIERDLRAYAVWLMSRGKTGAPLFRITLPEFAASAAAA
jgi:hypothetical protein